MSRHIHFSLFLVATLFVGGCDLLLPFLPGHGGGGSPALTVVREGTTVPLLGSRDYLRYVEKVNDSRCPEGAECVQAGEAVVHMTLIYASGDSADFRLSIPGLVDAHDDDAHRPVDVNGYTFTLLSLDPYPDVHADPNPGHSVATVRVAVPTLVGERPSGR